MKKNIFYNFLSGLIIIISLAIFPFIIYAQTSSEYVTKGWAALGKREFSNVYEIVDKCISKFSEEADSLAKNLTDFPSVDKESECKVMDDVATCYFIKGEALMREGKIEEAKKVFQEIIDKYPFAQNFDPRGWYWSLREKSEITLKKLETGHLEMGEEENEKTYPVTKINLYDKGTEFPIEYEKYGEFQGVGSKDYSYIIKDPINLAKAAGEGIYPNTISLKFDPEYIKIKKELSKVDHWQILNSRDLNTAFYKWNIVPESAGIKQFYLAELLERSGLIQSAIKAYYATLVHFPRTYAWTYWHTPWYIGKAALYRLKFLIKNNPQLNLELNNADIQIINGYDNDIRNDIFIVNPGILKKSSFWEKNILTNSHCQKKRNLKDIANAAEGENIKLIKYKSGDWQLLVNGKPFIIKGITYSPTRVGESPDDGTQQNWTTQDLNQNGLIDSPYESWVDLNKNNIQDENEKVVGDFYLLKKMGVNVLRVYHQPFPLNKEIFRQLHAKYGIYIILGDFLGKYTLGSNADWDQGTDYDNPLHKKNMLESIKQMVLEFKDEPYVLIWLLGNENVYGLGCNADKKPASFFSFANEAALLIKSLDPQKRPVAISSGDILYLDIFAKNAPDIDIFGTNSYRGPYGFLDLWGEVKRVSAKPVMITEYGASAYGKSYSLQEAEEYQAEYHKNNWLDILFNSAGFGAGNAIGGIAYEWLDEWWKAYEPGYHDKKGLFSGPFLDGYMHEEWLGICGQGEGKHSPYLRQLRKAYETYAELWGKN
ncbi:MAG: hypothetical protein KBB01_05170 [Candidatus Omnitrophica bacterium]|jgi:beta-glucuronidase|nr:hypothetical protein [Candidatus Omnitrophota bacterium]